MKKILPVLFFSLFIFMLISCALFVPTVVRWPDASREQGSRTLPLNYKTDIFSDFLWTTPDIVALETGGTFEWKGETISFEIASTAMTIWYRGEEIKAVKKTSENLYYPELAQLKSRIVYESRWVSETVTVPETVTVWKTRMVPRMQFNPDGSTTTIYVSESYTELETHYVTKTNWKWESYPVSVYDIPSYEYYDVQLSGNDRLLIYEVMEKGVKKYLVQNPSYLMVTEKEKSFWGEKDVNIIFIDANSNGVFFEDQDKVLFNVWNPYDRNSSYRQLPRIIDNQWYGVKDLQDDLFVYFEEQGDRLFIGYENDKYINNNKSGNLIIENFDFDNKRVFVNGQEYTTFFGTNFKCEYGKYHIVLSIPGHLDYEEVFVIDDENPKKVIDYKFTEEAGAVSIKNIFAAYWMVKVTGEGMNKTYFKTDMINLPPGEYEVHISVEGFIFKKSVVIEKGKTEVINFEEEIKRG
ncbi:MAG: carboxypeptidase regulatory-like domain-containing protein [Spirochaetales bacterium]|nr:carboxypeptidase regulatory-like domain-containing protein [Spirochaetales bacterium]